MNSNVVVITGASKGLGLALARRFAQRGDRLVINARGEELREVERELSKLTDVVAVPGDVSEIAEDIARVTSLGADGLTRIVDFRGLFQLPAVVYLHTVQIHSIHHRGQLSMYLRPMGAKVPAIYGESYDSARAKATV